MNNNKEKYLHNIAARFIMNEDVDVELSGGSAEIECLQELLVVSKALKESFDKDCSLEKIKKIIDKKRELSKRFQNLSGIVWRL